MRLIKCSTHAPRVTMTPPPDGTATEFTCSHGLEPGTADLNLVYLNGLIQHEGSGEDYTIGSFQEVLKIKFNTAPGSGEKLDAVFYGIGG